MAEPKKQSSPRKTGTRRSHLILKLARRVNGTSPVKIYTTRRESGKKKVTATVAKTTAAKPAADKKKLAK